MSIVRFATICDAPGCKMRSPEYTRWPDCRECLSHTCPNHMAAGSLRQNDYGVENCLCMDCAAELAVSA